MLSGIRLIFLTRSSPETHFGSFHAIPTKSQVPVEIFEIHRKSFLVQNLVLSSTASI